MAARKRKILLTDTWRAKISASMIIRRLQDHIVGTKNRKTGETVYGSLSTTQIKAAEILLKKVAPDLATISGPGEEGEHKLEIVHRMTG